MDTTVKQLVERFNNGTATPEERLALLRMVQSGEHAEYFGDELEARILYFLENPHLLDITEEEDRLATELSQASRKVVYRYSSPTPSLTTYWPWAAAAAVLILIATTFYFNRQRNTIDTIANNTPTTQLPQQTTTRTFTGRQWLHLPDGTAVLLNDNSQLQYDSTFNTTTRTVTLTGEAYFDVQHDPTRPFHVKSGAIDTQVLGTAFNIKAYPDQKNITVVVTRGRVKVSDSDAKRELAIITPKQQLSINAVNTRQFTTQTVEPTQALSWKKDFLIFDDIKISEAATLITAKYGTQITYPESFANCRIDAAFIHSESLDQVLTVVTKVFHGSYSIDGPTATIIGTCE